MFSVIGWSLLIAMVGFIVFEIRKENIQCTAKHQNKEYTTETLFAETDDGCKINRVTKFDSSCHGEGYVYFTRCPKTVTWREQAGKSSTERSNTTEIK